MKNKESEIYNNPYKKDFPIFNNNDVAYLDNAATAQRPECVINAVSEFYEKYNANPMRGLYKLSIDATEAYEHARETVRKFINAEKEEEIIFTRNTTESINLVAYSYGLTHLSKDDEIVITIMEHHSNMLPWQMVAKHTGAKLKYLECSRDGIFKDEDIENIITDKTKIVACTYISNVYGRINPVEKIIETAHRKGAVVLIDAAQAAPHIKIDVTKLDADFLAFSGHKLMAPMGIGVLYGKEEILDDMDPFLTGGEMIDIVRRDGAVFAELPHKFEAGTVNAAGAYGLEAAINYINKIGFNKINEIEEALTTYAIEEMKKIPHVNIIGSDKGSEHCGIITFTIDDVHPHDIASIFSTENVDIRAGHHCAQPLMDFLEVHSTVRASIYFYNTLDDINKFLNCLKGIRRRMGYGE